ncbi:zona pellucida sperm-binding protein 2 [Pseudophryne corroboree]|uniref:zona pellucida sperm-binding protein 2 n=1 Tax=Pseudophryne corroboree TaxID=495146 RepID=UPI0030816101
MGPSTRSPIFWVELLVDCSFLFLQCCLVLSEAARLPDFPGDTTCLDDGIQTTKPEWIPQGSWMSLNVVDSAGLDMEACDIHPDDSLLTIPERCATYEMGRMVSHISFKESMGQKSPIYRVACDEQSDSANTGPVIECKNNYMKVWITRTLSGFDDEVPSTPPPASAWTIGVNNGTLQKFDQSIARKLGYTLSSDPSYLMILIDFNAFGIQKLVFKNQAFYYGYLQLIQSKVNPKITIDVAVNCARGPPLCDAKQMTILIPPLAGILQYIDLGDIPISLSASALQRYGMTLDTRDGVNLSISKDHLQEYTTSGRLMYYLPSLTLTFDMDGISVAMELSTNCSVNDPVNHTSTMCTNDGFMIIEVASSLTKPNLDLSTVTLGDGTCQPNKKTNNRISFKIPLNGCGTTTKFVGGKVIYENEVRALWKDLPPRKISRDSELRETIQCIYDGSIDASLNPRVVTPTPPVSAKNDGPLSLVMSIYPDVTYGTPYRDNQYPVVKTLRDAIFLEVQVLNRNDPNIELVLDDCWATMFQDPESYPQWSVVVDGCQANQDNYLTAFHTVSNVALPLYRKRFEVKAFAFVQGEPSTNLIYFHCSAMICNIQAPDSPLCSTKCPMSRKKRDVLLLHRHSTLVSLHGPILLDSVPTMKIHDEQDLVGKVTTGVLPAFGLVAVVVLAAVVLSAFRLKSKP